MIIGYVLAITTALINGQAIEVERIFKDIGDCIMTKMLIEQQMPKVKINTSCEAIDVDINNLYQLDKWVKK